ncbi:MAG: hypothetical protein M1830_000439 [Pleopsidium flavum]|nr:MAG: hypothetical protein M1830_000439 [Pleopsidium flavum]
MSKPMAGAWPTAKTVKQWRKTGIPEKVFDRYDSRYASDLRSKKIPGVWVTSKLHAARKGHLEKLFEPSLTELKMTGDECTDTSDDKGKFSRTVEGSLAGPSKALGYNVDCNSGIDQLASASLDHELLADFQGMKDAYGQTDYRKYLLRIENEMSYQERVSDNVLLDGDCVLELSHERSLVHLHSDRRGKEKESVLLFKDLPIMQQGSQIGQAMYMLGYDLSSGVEVLRLTTQEVTDVLERKIDEKGFIMQQTMLPEWHDELDMKIVVLILIGQWLHDFNEVFQLGEVGANAFNISETEEIAEFALERTAERERDPVNNHNEGIQEVIAKCAINTVAGKESKGDIEIHKSSSKESEVLVGRSEYHVNAEGTIEATSDHGSADYAAFSIKIPRVRKIDTYDGEEEEEWATLVAWREQQTSPTKLAVTGTEPVSAQKSSKLSPENGMDPTQAFSTSERVQWPEFLDEDENVDQKRFSNTSTLCEDCEAAQGEVISANTARNAQLQEGSLNTIVDAYLKNVAKYPENDSVQKRKALLKFLLGMWMKRMAVNPPSMNF